MRFREISWPPTSRKRSKISRHGSWVSGGVFDVDRKKSRIALIERDSGQPNFWDDNAKAQGLLKEKAALEATEEAVYNSLLRATPVTSALGTAEALPIGRVVEVLRRYGRPASF